MRRLNRTGYGKSLLLFITTAAIVAISAIAATAAERIEPLAPEQAFRHHAAMENGNTAVITYTMPDGIYIYQNSIRLTSSTPGFSVTETARPPGSEHEDEFFGKSTVYYNALTLRAAVSGSGEFELLSRIQGCDEQVGICYPPTETIALLNASGGSGGDNSANTATADTNYQKDEAGYLSQRIAEGSIFLTIALFFLLGVGLSFTPCVLPMIPILLGIISGGDKNRRRILLLTGAYISGMALAFTGFGILAALSGQLLAVTLQQPWVLAGVAVLFVLLSASLFGAYELRLPSALANRLSAVGGGGGAGGAFLMGIVSAIVVSPCVAAPLVGALLYIGASGDVFTGAVALLSLALGMSVLLAVAGIAGSEILPRSGDWMERIKRLFGALLLFVAVWVAAPLLPEPLQLLLYGLLLIFTGLLLKPPPATSATASTVSIKQLLAQTVAIAAILWGMVMLLAAAAGSRDVLTPLSPFIAAKSGAQTPRNEDNIHFAAVTSLDDFQQRAAASTQPVMLDFYADWCISCKEFERFTLSDTRVQARLQNFLLLRADVTENNASDKTLLAHFNLYGPPAILFFAAGGEPIPGVRVIGYENADAFLETLAAAGI